MKRYVGIAMAAVICYAGSVTANPILIYNLPLISEFQMTDSVHWSIELRYPGYGFLKPPCSTSVYRLRIASSGKVDSIKFCFNAASIVVLTRASITGIPATEKVVIRPNDTIQILDSMWRAPGNQCWSFVVRPVKPGNSLVDFWGRKGTPFETTRPSVGTVGNYSNDYELYIMDSLNNLLPAVYTYCPYYISMFDLYFYAYSAKIIAPVLLYENVSLNNSSPSWLGFSCDSIPGGNAIYNFPRTQWHGRYVDTALSVKDTVRCNCVSGVKNPGISHNWPNVRLSAFPRSGGITFVIASPQSISSALVRIFAMSGRTLATLEVPEAGGGTRTLTWNCMGEHRKKIPAGRYVCKLIVNGAEAASRTVSVN